MSEKTETMEMSAEELEKKKKKEEKAREKELKKQKAAMKKEAAKFQQPSSVSKKIERKNQRKDAEEENGEDYIDPQTSLGEKKLLSRMMAKQYNPSVVEASWYAWWEKSGFFVADAKSSKPPYVIDTIIRWRRMSGYNTLWVPGGRGKEGYAGEKIDEVWKWKNEYGGTILRQQRRLCSSLDWSRECFTMDEKRCRAVTEAFVRLFKEGLIYRALRLVNWDCVLRTAISDIEVDYQDIKERTLLKVPGYEKEVEFGVLTSFAYPLEGNLGEIVVATTRVETMLGDTAIAVHPKDSRYQHIHGKLAIHPFNGWRLPIVCDDILVDPNFGTEATVVKLRDIVVTQQHAYRSLQQTVFDKQEETNMMRRQMTLLFIKMGMDCSATC